MGSMDSLQTLRQTINDTERLVPDGWKLTSEMRGIIKQICQTDDGLEWDADQAIQVAYLYGVMSGMELYKSVFQPEN